MSERTTDLAMLIAAVARRDVDPLTRFIRSLPEDLQRHADETVRLRDELVEQTQRILSSTDPQEAIASAEWLTRHAHEVAYRWGTLKRSVVRWSMLDTEAVFRATKREALERAPDDRGDEPPPGGHPKQ